MPYTLHFILGVFFLFAPDVLASQSQVEVLPQFSILSPTRLILSNENVEIPFSRSYRGIPAATVGMAVPFLRGTFQIDGLIRLGFGYANDHYEIIDRSGTRRGSDLSLYWIPVSLGTRVYYEISGFSYLKPGISFGGSLTFFRHAAAAADLSKSYWVPTVFLSPMLVFLEGNGHKEDWFGGFTFGATFWSSVANQTFNGVSLDLGLTILL